MKISTTLSFFLILALSMLLSGVSAVNTEDENIPGETAGTLRRRYTTPRELVDESTLDASNCPDEKPCIQEGNACWKQPECVQWYQNSCQHIEGLGGHVEPCMPSAAPSQAPTGWWEVGFGQDTARQGLSQTTSDECDLITIYLPDLTTDGDLVPLKALHLEVHSTEYSYYTNVDLVTVEIGTDIFVFDPTNVGAAMFTLNGVPTSPAANQASGYGTRLEGNRLALRPDACNSAAPCSQEVEQVETGEFKIAITPCI